MKKTKFQLNELKMKPKKNRLTKPEIIKFK